MNGAQPHGRLERITAAIEKHPAKSIAGVVLTAIGGAVAFFLLGFNYRKDIQEAALLDLVPKNSYVMKSDLPEMLTKKEIEEHYIERHVVERDYVPRKGSSLSPAYPADESPTQAKPRRLVFSTRRPFPASYDAVTPGMKFSDATRVFPGGKLSQGGYQVRLSDGLFSSILFLPTSHTDTDPVISVIGFNIAEGGPDAVVAALQEFGSLPHRSEVLGSRVVWPNLDGFELAVSTDSLLISRRN